MEKKCGIISIVGRPNVGKSTLLNYTLGQKISITSNKPQTTRYQIQGIKTSDNNQIIYVDTPGFHRSKKTGINRHMNRAAQNALVGIDGVIFVVEALRWTEEDQLVCEKLSKQSCPVVLAVNKLDRVKDKERLLPYIEDVSKKGIFRAIVPISARREYNLQALEEEIIKILPMAAHHYPEDTITDHNARFLCSEIIREKLMRQLNDELPYRMTVEIESFKSSPQLDTIYAVILVERKSHKKMIIGNNGITIKRIGSDARIDMEKLLDKKVMLNLWVKIQGAWFDNEQFLSKLYE